MNCKPECELIELGTQELWNWQSPQVDLIKCYYCSIKTPHFLHMFSPMIGILKDRTLHTYDDGYQPFKKKKKWWWTPDNPCMISSKLPTWLACIQVGTARWSKLVCRRKSYANHLVVPTLMYHSFRLDSAKHAETIQSVRRLHETLWKFPGQILDLFSCFSSDFGLVHRTDQSSWILAKQE